MKNNLTILKFVLAAFCLAANFACGSSNQANLNSSNNSNNSNTNAAANVPAYKPVVLAPVSNDPKVVCKYMPGIPVSEEYRVLKDDLYVCRAKKFEKTSGGNGHSWNYEAFGNSANIKSIEFNIVLSGTPAEQVSGEKRFVAEAEKLFKKAFAKPLPEQFKTKFELNRGKAIKFFEIIKEPVYTTISRSEPINDNYVLKIEFRLD